MVLMAQRSSVYCTELYTVEPLNKGQLGTGQFVPCSEVGLSVMTMCERKQPP